MKHKSKKTAGRIKRRRRSKILHKAKRERPHSKRRLSWNRRVEQTTLDHIPGDVVVAEQLFGSLSIGERALILGELVNTRAAELCRAYPAVIAVSYGFRRRKDAETGRQQIAQEACVKLLVKRKWRPGFNNPKRALPKHLFTYWTIDGVRRLCAIPTDVEDSRIHSTARPHNPQTVTVSTGSPPVATGALTCMIQRSSDHDKVYVMSCKHVFSPMRALNQTFKVAQIRLKNGGQRVATTVNVAGILSPVARRNLDSQLALVEDIAKLRVALGGVKIEGYVRSQGEAMSAARLWIVTPARGPIRATINAFRHEEHSIDYGESGVIEDIRHEEIIEVQMDRPTRGGDSGSPMVTNETGGLLVGMLIAGPPDIVSDSDLGTLSYVIPAWHLFESFRYEGAKPTEVWTLSFI